MTALEDFSGLWRDELALCGISEGDVVAALSDGSKTTQLYEQALLMAAHELGASPFVVTVLPLGTKDSGESGSPTRTPLTGNPGAIEALQTADLVVDLVFLLFSPEQTAILDSGARMLLCLEPIDCLTRLFPTREQRRRVEVGEQLLADAKVLRFTNPAGTDVTYQLGDFGFLAEYGYTDIPGRWDHWPSGFVAACPNEGAVEGRVVLAPGDIIFPFKSYVKEPISLQIEGGRIVDIRGGYEADLLSDFVASFEDEDAYGISHIGWGLNEKARWSSLLADPRSYGMEARAFYGNVLFSTGPNSEFGGTNFSACHLDIPMHGCSLFLDDEQIVCDGDVVIDDMKA